MSPELQVQLIGLIVSSLTFIIVIYQSIMMRKTFFADHERRKKQATIEFVTSLRNMSWPLEIELINIFGESVPETTLVSPQENSKINRYLSIYNQLATGVNIGVHDYDIVRRLMGGHIKAIYKKFEPYISSRRNENFPTYAIELEDLMNRILEDPMPGRDRGIMVHAK